jgi:hypothetical protein
VLESALLACHCADTTLTRCGLDGRYVDAQRTTSSHSGVANGASTADDPESHVRAQDLVSRLGALDGLDSWPPPGVAFPAVGADGGEDDLVALGRLIVLGNETEIRRVAQLARLDTTAWHALKFSGGPLDEKEHVMSTLLPSWAGVGAELVIPLHKLWEGERDEGVLVQDASPGAALILRILLHLMEEMEKKIAVSTDSDIFSQLPPTTKANVAVWGATPYHVYKAGDVIEFKWQFDPDPDGGVPAQSGPPFVDLVLHRGEGQGIVRLRTIEERKENTGRLSWTVPDDLSPADLGPEQKLHLVVSDSTSRLTNGHSPPFSVEVEGAEAAHSRAGRSVRMFDAKVGLGVVRGPDWRFGVRDCLAYPLW